MIIGTNWSIWREPRQSGGLARVRNALIWGGGWTDSHPVQAAVLTLRRRATHDRSASTASAAASSAHWEHFWGCQPCSYAVRSGDLRSVTKISDFYSARQWHNVGM